MVHQWVDCGDLLVFIVDGYVLVMDVLSYFRVWNLVMLIYGGTIIDGLQ